MPNVLSKFEKPAFDPKDSIVFATPYSMGKSTSSLINFYANKNPEHKKEFETCFKP
jgi:hypothetical protein